jgi:hypothetical protein
LPENVIDIIVSKKSEKNNQVKLLKPVAFFTSDIIDDWNERVIGNGKSAIPVLV